MSATDPAYQRLRDTVASLLLHHQRHWRVVPQDTGRGTTAMTVTVDGYYDNRLCGGDHLTLMAAYWGDRITDVVEALEAIDAREQSTHPAIAESDGGVK